MKKWLLRFAAGTAVLLLALWTVAGYIGVEKLLFEWDGPSSREDPAAFEGFPAEPVTLTTKDGVSISAWHVNAGGDRAVALFHGIGASRGQMSGTAKCYLEHGVSVLLADLRRHGKSGNAPTFLGLTERFDVGAAVDFLRGRYAHVGAHGFSLGAASVAFAMRERKDFDFVVLASSYDTARNALYDRLDLVRVPRWLAAPFVLIARWRLGVTMDELSPLDCMAHAAAPTLILGGDSEKILKREETEALFRRCAAAVKRLHIFKGGRHEAISGDAEEFRSVLAAFLQEALPEG